MTKTEQRLRNLERANEVRLQRSEWKRENAELSQIEGLARVIGLVDDVPEWAETWRLTDVLSSVSNLGSVKVRRMMLENDLLKHGAGLRLGWMTDRQKGLVIGWARNRIKTRR